MTVVISVALGVGLGAAIWGSWLGWDHTASYDSVTGTVQDPYVTLQVLGCALTLGAAVVVMAALGRPVEGASGAAIGFWLPWTVDAVSHDDSGLAGVGAVMLAAGLAAGVSVAALGGRAIRGRLGPPRRRSRSSPE